MMNKISKDKGVNNNRKLVAESILVSLMVGSAAFYQTPVATAAGNNVVSNNTLPTGPINHSGNMTIHDPQGNVLNINQAGQNGFINWKDFSIGANATVNFKGDTNAFNTLNYVSGGNMSQIYGTMNANNNGNIYVVNPNGVQIGNSAQINVGSLYVSNKALKENELYRFDGNNLDSLVDTTKTPNAELMSLGNINANRVTFDGSRIVLDVDRLGYNTAINIKTNDAGNVVLGHDEEIRADANGNKFDHDISITDTVNDPKNPYIDKFENGDKDTILNKNYKYQWIKDLDDLKDINDDLINNEKKNYALRNAIDAVSTKDTLGTADAFISIGKNTAGFKGKFDGLGNGIYGLTISDTTGNVGLFAKTDGATIRNLNLVGGSVTGGKIESDGTITNAVENVGALVGTATNTTIENIVSSVDVIGRENVGGIIGTATNNTTMNGLVNTGTTKGHKNVGGLIGAMENSSLETTASASGSYSLGAVYGMRLENTDNNPPPGVDPDPNKNILSDEKIDNLDEIKQNNSSNIGGLVGSAKDSNLGNSSTQIFNQLDVKGGTNVGGIVGSMEGGTIQNAANYGKITATGMKDGTYSYHGNKNGNNQEYTDKGDAKTTTVNVANAGGVVGISTGGSINNVINEGDVQSVEVTSMKKNPNFDSSKPDSTDNPEYIPDDTFYIAGNVGGIVGSAENTNITDAENKENNIRGAHNVGGIAGYYTGQKDPTDLDKFSTITNSVNNGGDIMGTGARDTTGNIVEEAVRNNTSNTGTNGEKFIIGNIGGIVGYMYDDGVRIENSANRGTVHSKDIEDDKNVLQSSQAANVGGIAGKIDRTNTKTENDVTNKNAAISNSYNTGDIRGYTGIGGIAGMMYNGEIFGSYNSGYIRTTRQSVGNNDTYTVINMGGLVGDTTEETSARVLIKDSYNKGTIGDETFLYKGRHVGGIAGRLAGDVINSYNKGDIYNGYAVTGGIAGWWTAGKIENAFNTGNITVYNHDTRDHSQIGGIVGGTARWAKDGIDTTKTINNAYNLGTLRSTYKAGAQDDWLGGIVGGVHYNTNDLKISNVYTTGELYIQDSYKRQNIGSIYGHVSSSDNAKAPEVKNAYYIEPTVDGFINLAGDKTGADTTDKAWENGGFIDKSQAITIKKDDKYNTDAYKGLFTDGNASDTEGEWRIYEGSTTPILNAFLPQLATDTDTKVTIDGVAVTSDSDKIQFGTAYNPFLSIFKDGGNVVINDKDGGAIANTDSIAVYNGGSLTINNAENTSNTMYSGILYADGALNLNGAEGADIKLGSISSLYGSSVAINTDGEFVGYGTITATGANGNSNVSINAAGDVEIIGTVTSVKDGETTTVDGIGQTVKDKDFTGKDITNTSAEVDGKDNAMPTTGSQYKSGEVTSQGNGNINITSKDGDVNILYGNKENGYINSSGDLTVTGDNVYMDSDLSVGGNLTMTSGTGNNQEAVLDISNIGKHYADGQDQNMGMHYFLENFNKENTTHKISINSDNAKIAVDMWDGNELKIDKYDTPDKLKDHLNNLNVWLNDTEQRSDQIKDSVYIWVNNAEQLKNIQDAANSNGDVLNYNFALKNDIDASGVTNYASIGGNTGFSGKFDGRDNRIVGLTSNNGGIFSTINEGGSVKDVKVYDSSFSGSIVGAIANVNKGDISGITTFGNEVSSNGAGTVAGEGVAASGGIAGVNEGTVHDSTVTDVIIAGANSIPDGAISTAGGVVGVNVGKINNVGASSAVVATQGKAYSIGGVAGVNATNGDLNGEITDVSSSGITDGKYMNSDSLSVPNVGGIVGANADSAIINEAYNESITSGANNVGGIVGWNESNEIIKDVANAGSVEGTNSVGGLVGSNGIQVVGKNPDGTNKYEFVPAGVSDGRNTGVVTGAQYVGGLVGSNGASSKLDGLTNDLSGTVTGDKDVGGIAGINYGTIVSHPKNEDDAEWNGLVNNGTINGHENVGGIAGSNYGTIKDTISNATLHHKDGTADTGKYFGGIVGNNDIDGNYKGTISNSTNYGTITTDNVEYVGGIAGKNTGLIEEVSNSGEVTAENSSYVGGIVGINGDEKQLDRNLGELRGDISNIGKVTGKENVGGIAGINHSENFENGTKLYNKGEVTATDGGAGGIFYENTASFGKDKDDTFELTFVNDKNVTGIGKENVGGIFGTNSGNISHSSLINTVNGTVTGGKNTGGLVGNNTGKIEGGRDGAGNYYKYQVYNNGTVIGTENTGGLIGNNAGTLTAGYNTGSVTGTDNVGGIAGTNSGSIDQTFNTPQGDNSVSGDNNVGGLVGANSGALTDSYSTMNVSGQTTNVGNAIGNNTAGNDIVKNIYSDKTTGKLIGLGNTGTHTYSFVQGDTSATTFLTGDAQKDKDSYQGFNNGNSEWKFYDGATNPILRVFLTKAVYHGIEPNFKYDGNIHGVVVQADPERNVVWVCDVNNPNIKYGWIDAANKEAAHSLADYFNTNTGALTDLINGNTASEMGSHELLFSQQINTAGKNNNPNNLGYEFVSEADINTPIDPSVPPEIDKIVPPKFEISTDGRDPMNWDYLYKDAPWDRNRNFRERKAEFNYVKGGVEIEENVTEDIPENSDDIESNIA